MNDFAKSVCTWKEILCDSCVRLRKMCYFYPRSAFACLSSKTFPIFWFSGSCCIHLICFIQFIWKRWLQFFLFRLEFIEGKMRGYLVVTFLKMKCILSESLVILLLIGISNSRRPPSELLHNNNKLLYSSLNVKSVKKVMVITSWSLPKKAIYRCKGRSDSRMYNNRQLKCLLAKKDPFIFWRLHSKPFFQNCVSVYFKSPSSLQASLPSDLPFCFNKN